METVNINVARADKENNNTLLTPADCLEGTLAEIKNGKRCDRLLILTLSEGGDGRDYDNGFRACNLSCSQMLSLLEVTKADVHDIMKGN